MSGNSYINDNGDGDNCKRKRSSLRSAVANVKVYVGKDLIFDKEPKEFWHYSHILASQSGYIDTLLSTPLSKKNDSFPLNDFIEISIVDIAPSQWTRRCFFRFRNRIYHKAWITQLHPLPTYSNDYLKNISCGSIVRERCQRC